MTAVACGVDGCTEDLALTYGPAAALRCSIHGDVVDVPPSPPLLGGAIVCSRDGCEVLEPWASRETFGRRT